jgi:sec-independent protein translocase protein TatA
MELSPMHLLIILLIVLVLFGGRKLPELMRGMGTGIREFKEGMREQPSQPPTNPPASTPTNAPAATPTPTEPKK